jgi:hypothetical protein
MNTHCFLQNKGFDGDWPKYNSILLVELWREQNATNNHYIRLIYNGTPLHFGGNEIERKGEYVTWSSFREMALQFVPHDFHERCQPA